METKSSTRPKLNKIHKEKVDRAAFKPKIVSHAEWVKSRKELLAEEKDVTRHIDAVVNLRRSMPWEEVTKDYVFKSETGNVKLAELMTTERPELIVYHMMYPENDDFPCSTCSYFIDGFNGYTPHLNQRCNIVVVGKADIDKLTELRVKKGWTTPVLSSVANDFNLDYGVERTKQEEAAYKDKTLTAIKYNYGEVSPWPVSQYPGVSVFAKHDGKVYHTYSGYARGLDIINAGNALMDLLPFGREGFQPKHKHLYEEETQLFQKSDSSSTLSPAGKHKKSDDSSHAESGKRQKT